MLRYLGRYTHRVAISNHRLLAFDGERVTFRWKDYAHGNKRRTMTLSGDGVPAPLHPTHPAARLRPHPASGFLCQYSTAVVALARTLAPRGAFATVATPTDGLRDDTGAVGCPRCGATMTLAPTSRLASTDARSRSLRQLIRTSPITRQLTHGAIVNVVFTLGMWLDAEPAHASVQPPNTPGVSARSRCPTFLQAIPRALTKKPRPW